jgi:hypothetical protein
MSLFNNSQVARVSKFLQAYLKKNKLLYLTADECADLLAKKKLLKNDVGPKPGFNFRQMLRDGRDKKINQVEGAFQSRPNTRWKIYPK